MNDNIIFIILIMALITYLTRFPMLLLSSRIQIPAWLERGLRMVPVGVFSSLTIPPILFHIRDGVWNPEYLAAGVVALSIGLWKKHIFLSLLSGVVFLFLWRLF